MGQNGWVRILIFGAGVIGSVYGGRLLAAGHDVVLLARGGRLNDLRQSGLVLQDAQSGHRTALPVTAVAAPEPGDQFDLVVAPVRRDQLPDTLPLLTGLTRGLTCCSSATRRPAASLPQRSGGGLCSAFRRLVGAGWSDHWYVQIRPQKTMLGEATAPRPAFRQLQSAFSGAGFPDGDERRRAGLAQAHAAFVVPVAFALYRDDIDASMLATDPATMREMVRATRQAFSAAFGRQRQIPGNLRSLYLGLPTPSPSITGAECRQPSRRTLVRRP